MNTVSCSLKNNNKKKEGIHGEKDVPSSYNV